MKIFQYDKIWHFIFGFLIALLVGLLIAPQIGLISAVLLGLGKELYDYHHPKRHIFDGWDATWTIIGGIVATLFIW